MVLPILLFALGGILAGGAWSMRQQGASRGTIAVVVLIGVLAIAAGVAWLLPEGR
jgi:hypothetical protein